jgi:hypothetical protein
MTAVVRGAPGLAVWGRWLPEPSAEAQLFPGLTVVLLVIAGIILRPRTPRTEPAPPRGARGWPERIAVATGWLAVLFSLLVLTALIWPWRLRFAGISISVTRATNPAIIAALLWIAFMVMQWRRGAREWRSVAAFARRAALRQSAFAFYVFATVAMWFLSFGPELRFLNQPVTLPAPYSVLLLLPGFDGIRVPARFAMLAALCIAAAASVGLARLLARLPKRAAAVVTVAAAIGVLADGWISEMPLVRLPRPSVVAASDTPGAVLEIPLGEQFPDIAAMYRGIAHRHPVVNGFSGYSPPHYEVLRAALAAGDPSVIPTLAALGVRHVVVNEGPEDLVLAYPGATRGRNLAGVTQFELTPDKAPVPPPASHARSTVPVARVVAAIAQHEVPAMFDGNLATSWSSQQPQSGADTEVLTVDLGQVREVTGIELALGAYPIGYPRELRVERSVDGAEWAAAWQGTTGGRSIVAALEDPRRIPLRIEFAPAAARYVRLRQLGTDKTAPWTAAELAILGSRP